MLFRTTYKDSVQEALVNDLVGLPFSLLNRINMKGVGSKRLIIENLSPGLSSTLNKIADINPVKAPISLNDKNELYKKWTKNAKIK